MTTLADDDRAAYLRRLGLEAEPPSVEALFRLHRAQVEQIPYETLWIHLGQAWGIDPTKSARRIAHGTRGGYCFHLNGAFAELLSSLGYAVARHVGGVHGPDGATEDEMNNHLVLSVTGLPSDENPEGTWYVDAGLGDALHEPTPLAPATYVQTPFTMRLDETPGDIGDWHLTHDPAGGFAGMAWRSAPTAMAAFAEKHRWLSTDRASGFVRVVTVQRRDATGVDILRGCVLQRVGDDARSRDLATKAELDDALADVFGIDLTQLDPDAYRTMWEKMQREHGRWVEAGRP